MYRTSAMQHAFESFLPFNFFVVFVKRANIGFLSQVTAQHRNDLNPQHFPYFSWFTNHFCRAGVILPFLFDTRTSQRIVDLLNIYIFRSSVIQRQRTGCPYRSWTLRHRIESSLFSSAVAVEAHSSLSAIFDLIHWVICLIFLSVSHRSQSAHTVSTSTNNFRSDSP